MIIRKNPSQHQSISGAEDCKTGSCACGQLQIKATLPTIALAACHCSACKKRTGSSFGIGCVFNQDAVTLSGNTKVYRRVADTERWVDHHFCPDCGSTVYWLAEAMPGGIIIAGGSFDETEWIQPQIIAWQTKALDWFSPPNNAKVFDENPVL